MENANNMEKKLDLTYLEMIWEKNRLIRKQREVEVRNARAEKYINYCERRRKAKEECKQNICMVIFGVVLATALIVAICIGIANAPEPRYAIAGNNGNGCYYIYVTERICTVTEITQDYVTVSYNGNEYDFFGYGYEIGEEIVCQFTDGMEIVGVVER